MRKSLFSHALFVFVAGLFLIFGQAVKAQSALDGFDPNANGTVRAIVVQPDGKILIGGDFTTVAPNGGAAIARRRIARLNSDGTLDTAFNPNANSSILSIVLQPDGRILIGRKSIRSDGKGETKLTSFLPFLSVFFSFYQLKAGAENFPARL